MNRRANLQVHHLNYERVGNERDDDLILLCHRCHEGVHKQIDRMVAQGHPKEVVREAVARATLEKAREIRAKWLEVAALYRL